MTLHIEPNEGERSRMLHHLQALCQLMAPYDQPNDFSDWQKRYLEHMDALACVHGWIVDRANQKIAGPDGLDAETICESELVAEETKSKPDRFVIELDLKRLAITVSAMQLALRNPDFKTTGAAARVQHLVDHFISMVPDTLPHYRRMLQRGNEHPQGPNPQGIQ